MILKNSMEMCMEDLQEKYITKASLFLIRAKICHFNFRIMSLALSQILGTEKMW